METPRVLSPVEDATDETQMLIDSVYEDFMERCSKNYSMYKALQYKTEGTSFYFVKVQVEPDNYAHLKVFKPSGGSGPNKLSDFQLDKGLNDEIRYF
ncbi:cystatin-B [Aplysia californica]|uniref:Cystatin-B n=1 Tax=Aplysia californica TaxID=6500 RepID=A0ABM0JCM9_APLCA|nr:cystatin-B [Aplysia californica]